MTGSDEFLPLHIAARVAGVHVRSISRRIHDGRLPAYEDPRDLRKRLVRIADLDSYFGTRRRIDAAAAREEALSDVA